MLCGKREFFLSIILNSSLGIDKFNWHYLVSLYIILWLEAQLNLCLD